MHARRTVAHAGRTVLPSRRTVLPISVDHAAFHMTVFPLGRTVASSYPAVMVPCTTELSLGRTVGPAGRAVRPFRRAVLPSYSAARLERGARRPARRTVPREDGTVVLAYRTRVLPEGSRLYFGRTVLPIGKTLLPIGRAFRRPRRPAPRARRHSPKRIAARLCPRVRIVGSRSASTIARATTEREPCREHSCVLLGRLLSSTRSIARCYWQNVTPLSSIESVHCPAGQSQSAWQTTRNVVGVGSSIEVFLGHCAAP